MVLLETWTQTWAPVELSLEMEAGSNSLGRDLGVATDSSGSSQLTFVSYPVQPEPRFLFRETQAYIDVIVVPTKGSQSWHSLRVW